MPQTSHLPRSGSCRLDLGGHLEGVEYPFALHHAANEDDAERPAGVRRRRRDPLEVIGQELGPHLHERPALRSRHLLDLPGSNR